MLPYLYDCIIIGAGASGLMCAASMAAAPREDFRGLILEATAREYGIELPRRNYDKAEDPTPVL